MSHWTMNGKPFTKVPDKAFGFVYLITHTKTGKKYIGRKQFGSVRRKPLTKKQKESGRVKRTVLRTESDWQTYTSSSTSLNEDILKKGKDTFIFEILVVCYTKGQCNFLEETLQHKYNVIWDDNYYNDAIGSGKWMSVKLPEDVKAQIKKIDKTLG